MNYSIDTNSKVMYQNGSLVCGDGYVTTPFPTPNDYYYDFFPRYWPVYYPEIHYVNQFSKVEQAFKIVAKLIENKMIEKEITVKEFMKIVNDIAKIL